MTIHNPAEPMRPPSPSPGVVTGHKPDNALIDESTVGELSPLGLICDDMLSKINTVPGCPERVKVAIGAAVNNILTLFSKTESRARDDKRRISALKCDLHRLKEQLAVLRHAQFGQSSEKDSDAGQTS